MKSYFEKAGDETLCAGPVPNTFEEYTQAVLRPAFYCDALCLLGLARRLQVRIVVIMHNPGTKEWERRGTFGTATDAPIVLALRSSHYQLVQALDGCFLPDDWINANEDISIETLGDPKWKGGAARAKWIPPSSRGSV